MYLRYRAGLMLTSLLTLSMTSGSAKPAHHHRPAQFQTLLPMSADEMYSRRALRRARIILQLKLLELRGERLERVRKALERHIPIDKLLRDF